jgi:NAD+ kinase
MSLPEITLALNSFYQDADMEGLAVPSLLNGTAPDPYDRPKTAPSNAHRKDSSGGSPALPRTGSVRPHRKSISSVDSSRVPTQTIMKALVSRPPPNSQLAISTIRSIRGSNQERGPTHVRDLSRAISEFTLDEDQRRLTLLNSPCFFHKRFDDAVDLERVLQELQEDSWKSHSRLVQTATGVREVSRQLQRRAIKRAVYNVMIVTKARDNDLVVLTRQLAEWLLSTPRYGSDVGVNVFVDCKLKQSKRFDAPSLIAKDPRFESMLQYWTLDLCWSQPEKFDLVMTLGGDGTVLYTSWLFQRIVPPILSFSLGSLGFLTSFEFDTFQPTLTRLLGDAGMRVNLRMRFTCTVYRTSPDSASPVEAEQFEVLNEVVIDRGPSPYVSNLEIYGDDNLLTVAQADGVIFSTPTGSTAYSLSAGGSLVHPDIPAILLTPICPHTLSFRPMLLRDSISLRVSVPRGSRSSAHVAFDGKGRMELRGGDYVTIACSQYPFPTVQCGDTEWIDSISRTLRWNSRGATQKSWSRSTFPGLESEVGSDANEDLGSDGEFDIDFGDEDAGIDSGYGDDSSAGAAASPLGKRTTF